MKPTATGKKPLKTDGQQIDIYSNIKAMLCNSSPSSGWSEQVQVTCTIHKLFFGSLFSVNVH